MFTTETQRNGERANKRKGERKKQKIGAVRAEALSDAGRISPFLSFSFFSISVSPFLCGDPFPFSPSTPMPRGFILSSEVQP